MASENHARGKRIPRIYYYNTPWAAQAKQNTVESRDDEQDQVDNGAGVAPPNFKMTRTSQGPTTRLGDEVDQGDDQPTPPSPVSRQIRPETFEIEEQTSVKDQIVDASRELLAWIIQGVRRAFREIKSKPWLRNVLIGLALAFAFYILLYYFTSSHLDERIRTIANEQISLRGVGTKPQPAPPFDLSLIDRRVAESTEAQSRRIADELRKIETNDRSWLHEAERKMRQNINQELQNSRNKIIEDLDKNTKDREDRMKQHLDASLDQQLKDVRNKIAVIQSQLTTPRSSDKPVPIVTIDKKDLEDLETRMGQRLDAVKRDVNTGEEARRHLEEALRALKDKLDTHLAKAQIPTSLPSPSPPVITQEEINQIRETLSQLSQLASDIEQRVLSGDSALGKRIDELAKAFITPAMLKVELGRLDLGLTAEEEKLLSERIEDRILARWENERDLISKSFQEKFETWQDEIGQELTGVSREVKDLRIKVAQQGQVGGGGHLPTEKISSEEIVENEKQRIEGWIRAALKSEVDNIIARLPSKEVITPQPAPPTEISQKVGEEIVRKQKELIDGWIRERFNDLVTPVVKEAENRIGEKVLEEVKLENEAAAKREAAKLTEFGSRMDKLATRQDQFETRNKETTERLTKLEGRPNVQLRPDQIEEIVRLLRASGLTAITGGLTRQEVQDLVEQGIERYAADRINMTDYALASGGASIVYPHTSRRYPSGLWNTLFGTIGEDPSIILTPSLALGHCWAFAGAAGNVSVRLSSRIVPTDVSIDHISAGVAKNIETAPKNFTVWGYVDRMALNRDEGIVLVQGTYNAYGSQVQTFPVQTEANDGVLYVKLGITSNHGFPEYTCVYRFRVHGRPYQPPAATKD
jgi:hypothetical protein